ncbi:MAG: hypothetical protein JW739_02205 [Opitutales bacterium]|nr:hypothetical protein [Opitutales bacterium]
MDQILIHKFVEFIPQEIEEGVLYISVEYGTARHKCCCGCGSHVITPITPTDWKLIYDGETVSLSPSIGSWNLPCQSHYFIRNNKVIWAQKWSKKEISQGRMIDKRLKEAFYSKNITRSEVQRNKETRDKKTNKLSNWLKIIFKNK